MERKSEPALVSIIKNYFVAIAGAAIIALFLRIFVVEAFRIPTDFMSPMLLPGDHIFVNKLAYGGSFGISPKPPKRGDVVVFSFPNDPSKDYIKRVVAVDGDEIEIRAGQVILNGKAVSRQMNEDVFEEEVDGRKYFAKWAGVLPEARKMMPVTVPQGQFFVLGDNRAKGQDSRGWGFLNYGYLKGRAAWIWFSAGSDGEGPLGLRWSRMFTRVN
ncbi:MAG: signal peptidase I [Bdellovibrionota bacterium]